MKVNKDALTAAGKLHFLIEETWQGMEPTASYQAQAAALKRSMDSVEYIERAFQQGTVVLAHKKADAASIIQLVAVDNLEQLNNYIKSNEAHARVRPENRKVTPLTDWNSARETHLLMITKMEIRAEHERDGTPQPSLDDLEREARARMTAP